MDDYVALIPFDKDLAPLEASSEMTRDFVLIDRIIQKLLAQTESIPIYGDDGEIAFYKTKFHHDLRWFLKHKFDIVKQISTLNALAGHDAVREQIDVLKIILEDKDMLTPEQRRTIGKQLMVKRRERIAASKET